VLALDYGVGSFGVTGVVKVPWGPSIPEVNDPAAFEKFVQLQSPHFLPSLHSHFLQISIRIHHRYVHERYLCGVDDVFAGEAGEEFYFEGVLA